MMQQVYGEDAVSRSVVFRWHRRFLQGRDSLEDDVRTGRPQTIRTERKIQEVATLVRANCSQSVDDIEATVGVSHGTCYKILSDDLNMSRVTQHSVPRILSQDQRDDRMTICGDLISSADDEPTFLNRIITGDETWCFLYDPQLKRQSATWKTPLSPRQKKPRQDRSKGKVLLELFFDSNGIIHMEFIPEGATLNKTRYKEILGRLRDSIRRKRPELWRTKNWLLLHDNAPAHRSVLVQEELARQQCVFSYRVITDERQFAPRQDRLKAAVYHKLPGKAHGLDIAGDWVAQLMEQLVTDWKIRGLVLGGDDNLSLPNFQNGPEFTQSPRN
ncbi:hypothetical protein ANN_17817 [Periplaneta americana]|uniref:Transposase n=1 Tax=Periplaneta americana TaxID=6978 RepID=A0ABQ8SVI5_PERAM|nr:hypothetical protein ANN_17817 [Periplaneta americana]